MGGVACPLNPYIRGALLIFLVVVGGGFKTTSEGLEGMNRSLRGDVFVANQTASGWLWRCRTVADTSHHSIDPTWSSRLLYTFLLKAQNETMVLLRLSTG